MQYVSIQSDAEARQEAEYFAEYRTRVAVLSHQNAETKAFAGERALQEARVVEELDAAEAAFASEWSKADAWCAQAERLAGEVHAESRVMCQLMQEAVEAKNTVRTRAK